MLTYDPDHIDDLFAAWAERPPLRIVVYAVAVGLGVIKPRQVEPTDLPDGSFERAKAATADLFKNPARFFQKPPK